MGCDPAPAPARSLNHPRVFLGGGPVGLGKILRPPSMVRDFQARPSHGAPDVSSLHGHANPLRPKEGESGGLPQ
eukprot:134738-Pyramimonas_sp.AAC.1